MQRRASLRGIGSVLAAAWQSTSFAQPARGSAPTSLRRAAVRAGGLMAYAPNMNHVYARSAAIVDRLLRGARPGDVPVEQPTRFVLSLNKSAARRIGFVFPQRVVLRADRVTP